MIKVLGAAWSWEWGLGAKSAVNAGAQRSKEREAQLARKDDIYPTKEPNWGPPDSRVSKGDPILRRHSKRLNQ